MKSKRRRKLSGKVIAAICTAAVAAVLLAAILITNIFIPIKYFTAYCVKRNPNSKGVMRVGFIDVGFGDSTLVELPDGKTVLIDGGDGAYGNNLNLLAYLNAAGVDTIDYLICTSVKKEHCGGLADIIKYKEVGFAYIPYCLNTRITAEYHAFISQLNKRNISYGYACAGEGIIDGKGSYFLTFLSPTDYQNPQSQYYAMNSDPTAANIDGASVVCWLEYAGVCFALTSDIRADGLKRIVGEYRACAALGQPYSMFRGKSVNLENCTVVTAPCHAGANGTYAPWYDLTKPEQAVISVGKNYSDYPSLKALSDICNYCQPLYTMYDGNITISVNGDGYAVTKSK